MNRDFRVCPTYPPLVAVPRDVDDDTLKKAAGFRHGGRFPVLSYYHKKIGMVGSHVQCYGAHRSSVVLTVQNIHIE